MKPEHGYHRKCYQRFTMNLGRLKASQVVEEESGPSRRSSTSSSDGIIFSPDCIFCNKTGLKKIKSNEVWTSEVDPDANLEEARLFRMQLYERMIKSFIAESRVWTYLLVRLFTISHVGEII